MAERPQASMPTGSGGSVPFVRDRMGPWPPQGWVPILLSPSLLWAPAGSAVSS